MRIQHLKVEYNWGFHIKHPDKFNSQGGYQPRVIMMEYNANFEVGKTICDHSALLMTKETNIDLHEF